LQSIAVKGFNMGWAVVLISFLGENSKAAQGIGGDILAPPSFAVTNRLFRKAWNIYHTIQTTGSTVLLLFIITERRS
jgi:hypothetical protein